MNRFLTKGTIAMPASNNSAGALRTRTQLLILCGVFAALTSVCAVISLPLPFTPVPVSLATLAVLMSGGILGAKYGALSQLVYILLGAVGLPVFSGFTAGFSILVGPTGGYIAGYAVAACIVGLLCDGLKNTGVFGAAVLAGAMVLGMAACCAVGTAWFTHATNTPLIAALGMCVFPFIPGDALKIAAATFLCGRLRGFVTR
jgi:biotin transport system substrate-specific component